MAEVLRFAQQTLGYAIVFDGGPGQEPAVEHLRAMAAGSVSVAGKTGLRQLAALAAASDLVLAVDTRPSHVAEAVGVPIVQLSPQWVKVADWHPLPSERVRLLHGASTGPVEDDYRMQELEVPVVKNALMTLSNAFPPSQAAREQRLQTWCSERDLLE